MLAGISADYYLRLERGRDRNPSVQVLESIARVLQLDDENMTYMLGLVADKPRRARRRRRSEKVPSTTATLLSTLPHPAYVEGRYFDVLASNRMAVALSPRLAVGGNQLLDVFLDSAEIALYPDWEGTTDCYVSSLRRSVGTDTEDPRFIELVGELCLASPRFRSLWTRHSVVAQRGTSLELDHPQVGEMRLNRERLHISGTDGMHLVILHPEPGSEDADKLALLGSANLRPTGTSVSRGA
jgi:transcriptional regulator with XRE-family HTH domain